MLLRDPDLNALRYHITNTVNRQLEVTATRASEAAMGAPAYETEMPTQPRAKVAAKAASAAGLGRLHLRMHAPKAVAAAEAAAEKEAAAAAAKVKAKADTPIGRGSGKKGKGGAKGKLTRAQPPSVQTSGPSKEAAKMKTVQHTDASVKGDDEHKIHRARDERHGSKQIGDQLKTKANELHQMKEW